MRKSVVASLPDRPDKRKYALEVVYHASKAFSMSLFFIYVPRLFIFMDIFISNFELNIIKIKISRHIVF